LEVQRLFLRYSFVIAFGPISRVGTNSLLQSGGVGNRFLVRIASDPIQYANEHSRLGDC
jgi:hypothetical protein